MWDIHGCHIWTGAGAPRRYNGTGTGLAAATSALGPGSPAVARATPWRSLASPSGPPNRPCRRAKTRSRAGAPAPSCAECGKAHRRSFCGDIGPFGRVYIGRSTRSVPKAPRVRAAAASGSRQAGRHGHGGSGSGNGMGSARRSRGRPTRTAQPPLARAPSRPCARAGALATVCT